MRVEVKIVYKRIVVPTTGAGYSWRAVRVGDALATRYGAQLEIYSVVECFGQLFGRENVMRAGVAMEHLTAPTVTVTAEINRDTVAKTIAAHMAAVGNSLAVMATAAHGRTEAILGSVSEELLTLTCGPVVLVGPHVDLNSLDLTHDTVVAVDGSRLSEAALWPATMLSVQLGLRPWITSVLEPTVQMQGDLLDSGYAGHLARRLGAATKRDVEFEVLHDKHPARAIVDFASRLGASFIVATTHGRTGLARMAMGSEAMGIVHESPCPVVLVHPLFPASTSEPVASVETAVG
jgi:nucleotide-binding universal stress UspA family protein